MELAVREVNSIGNAIHEDLVMAEQEVNTVGLNESSIRDLKELCATIKDDIDVRYRDASGKVVRMDLGRSSYSA